MSGEPGCADAKQATPREVLLAEILDTQVPKSEREHAAAYEIKALRQQRDGARETLRCVLHILRHRWRDEGHRCPYRVTVDAARNSLQARLSVLGEEEQP